MTNCKTEPFFFLPVKGRKVAVSFSGVEITSDGGAIFLREIDNSLNLTKRLSEIIHDPRNQRKIKNLLQ